MVVVRLPSTSRILVITHFREWPLALKKKKMDFDKVLIIFDD